MSINVNTKNFATEVQKAKGPVLVDFYGEQCLPCKLLRPILAGLANEYKTLKLCMFNTDREVQETDAEYEKKFKLLNHFQVMNLPTVLLFLDGELRTAIIGLHSKEEILEVFREHKIELR